MQLVLIKNRVVSYGGEYVTMGNTVIDTQSGKVFSGATVAECNGCPPDIGEVGYEYAAGVFTPCAPYGKGDGNLAVLCNRDCKSIKDSDIPLSRICQTAKTTYGGTGSQSASNPCSITFDFPPDIVFIMPQSTSDSAFGGYIHGKYGFAYELSSFTNEFVSITANVTGNTLEWYGSTKANECMNISGATYDVFAIGLTREV